MGIFKTTLAEQSKHDSINWDNLGFGRYFSDHMFISQYTNGSWDGGQIVPYAAMPIEPGNCTLHYGQTIFEGLKAFWTGDGSVNVFRPEMNAKRLNHSAERVCIPDFSENIFLDALRELIRVDQNFIPHKRGQSLYIRPVVFGSGNFLGVHASDTYTLIIMTSPVASYYAEGLSPVKILVANEFVRAVRGGLGTAKTAANYAASLLAGMKAKAAGYSQVLWLDGVEHKYIDEVGAMNIMFVIGDELITPPLSQGSILAGITRDSVLHLAGSLGIKASERSISIDEVFAAHGEGRLKEVFGTGTAAVISPVGVLHYKGETITINNNEIGPMAQKFYDLITGIQYGEISDDNNWNMKIEI